MEEGMPSDDFEFTAGDDTEAGQYAATLVSIERKETKEGDFFRVWHFKTVTGAELSGSSSLSSGPQSKAYRWARRSPELMERWASRDTRGHLLTWDWGEPDEEGFYTPAITTVDDGVRLVTAEALARALPEDWEPFWDEIPTV